jgi:hypothetical protein
VSSYRSLVTALLDTRGDGNRDDDNRRDDRERHEPTSKEWTR